jgi:hypothetical protein
MWKPRVLLMLSILISQASLADNKPLVFAAEVSAYYSCFLPEKDIDAYQCMRVKYAKAEPLSAVVAENLKVLRCRGVFKGETTSGRTYGSFTHFKEDKEHSRSRAHFNKCRNPDDCLTATISFDTSRTQSISSWDTLGIQSNDSKISPAGFRSKISLRMVQEENGFHLYIEQSVSPDTYVRALKEAHRQDLDPNIHLDELIDPVDQEYTKAVFYSECIP